MAGVEIHAHDAIQQHSLQLGNRSSWQPPGGAQVPAPPLRLVADVVADRPTCGLGGDLGAAVPEADLAVEPVAAVGTVGQEGKAARQLDLQPLLLGMPADGLVAEVLVGLAVGGDS
jgi:hypothetical protein